MFISVLDLFKIGIGPSSSHTMGPMVAAKSFREAVEKHITENNYTDNLTIRCILKGSLAYTGKGHATDKAVILGLHGYLPEVLVNINVAELTDRLTQSHTLNADGSLKFSADQDIIFDLGAPLPEHPNGMIFDLVDESGESCFQKTYFSIGGGFLSTPDEVSSLQAPLQMNSSAKYPYPFDSAKAMLEMSKKSGFSISTVKRINEEIDTTESKLDIQLDAIWRAMEASVLNGLSTEGTLPGGLEIKRRAKKLHTKLRRVPERASANEWLCAYALAVSEENAAGHMVVTAPTNGAAGVIPAVLYYAVSHLKASQADVRKFLLTAASIGAIIKHRSSISGAEVGCQGEVGSASAMAAAGLCEIRGGSPEQVEHAAEMALEHHLGMTCDPVAGLVQVPCIERNGFGAVKAFTAASLALLDEGKHFMPLDSCIAAMKQTGLEMSEKFKETSLGGLAISYTEC